MKRAALALLFIGCVPYPEEGESMRAGDVPDVETDSKSLQRNCGSHSVRGIDVSYYQATIDWDRVRGAGIEFAFIRVSDGLANIDSKFARNWAEAKRVGIRRGAYQFFRPNLDPIAQADLLLDRMGPLLPGDLPPVIDVEVTGNLSSRTIAQKVQQWIAHVQAALGVTPIIYTGPYFWRDSVGAPSFSSDHLLWIAHYTTSCPLVPEPWSQWTFHQYTESGSVPGISGGVDSNYFNGTLAQLDAIAVSGQPPPPATPCEKIAAGGGIVEEDSSCVDLGGPTQYLRSETNGHGGGLVWTGATSSSRTTNYAEYTIDIETPGTYQLEAYVATGTSRQTKYVIGDRNGSHDVVIDQSASGGFAPLGTFVFDASTYKIRIVDNTGEASSLNRRIVFDAISVMPAMMTPGDPNVCAPIASAGGIIEEDNACAELGGPSQYLRAETGGHDGGLVSTGATASQRATNYARWSLGFEQTGTYLVEAYVTASAQGSREARYRVTHANGSEDVFLDQSTGSGFIELGTFSFAAGGGYLVRLDDNTGEATSLGRRLQFDAVRVTPLSGALPCASLVPSSGVGALNIRPRPNTVTAAIAQISAGQAVDRLATVSGELVDGSSVWYRVRWGQTVGYISGRYASCE